MVQVDAGDKTGVYYIVVSGLPWNTSWQELKDFARDQPNCTTPVPIDHAHVYPGKTCTDGWVKVLGKDNFKKTFKHLNGGILKGKAIMADDRNGRNPLHLRDFEPFNPPPARSRHGSSAHEVYPPTIYHQSESSPTYSGHGNYPDEQWSNNYNNQQMATYPPSSPVFSTHRASFQTPTSPYEGSRTAGFVGHHQDYFTPVATANVMYAGNMAPQTPIFVAQPVYPVGFATSPMTSPVMHQHQYTENYTSAPPAYSDANTSFTSPISSSDQNHTTTTNYVQPEARKVIITKLPLSIADSELQTLLQARVLANRRSRLDCPIQSIEVQRGADGKSRGHAFVVFDSDMLARKCIAELRGMEYKGRKLDVRLAKEGVEPVGGFGNVGSTTTAEGNNGYYAEQSGAQYYAGGGGGGGNLVKSGGQSGKKHGHGHGHGEKNAAKKGEKSSSEKKEKEKEKERISEKQVQERERKEEKENRQPCVVNGSGSRRTTR